MKKEMSNKKFMTIMVASYIAILGLGLFGYDYFTSPHSENKTYDSDKEHQKYVQLTNYTTQVARKYNASISSVADFKDNTTRFYLDNIKDEDAVFCKDEIKKATTKLGYKDVTFAEKPLA